MENIWSLFGIGIWSNLIKFEENQEFIRRIYETKLAQYKSEMIEGFCGFFLRHHRLNILFEVFFYS